MSMDAPPTPVSPTMEPSEKKEKKRKRDRDPEKIAKKQKREGEAATDSRVEDGWDEGRAEKKKKRKEKKHKGQDEEEVNGTHAEGSQLPDHPSAQTDGDSRTKDEQATTDVHDSELQKHSPFMQRTLSFYLPLSPCAANFPLEGLLAEHISPLLLTYYPPMRGVLLSYSNPRLSEGPDADASPHEGRVLSQCINEYAVTFTWLTADFLLLRPRKGTWLEGYVRLGNESMIGLVCYNYFNAVIEREKMPADWTWVAEEGESEVEEHKGRRKGVESAGYFQDERGGRIEGRLVFRVEDFDALQGDGGGSVSIMGTLLPEERGR